MLYSKADLKDILYPSCGHQQKQQRGFQIMSRYALPPPLPPHPSPQKRSFPCQMAIFLSNEAQHEKRFKQGQVLIREGLPLLGWVSTGQCGLLPRSAPMPSAPHHPPKLGSMKRDQWSPPQVCTLKVLTGADVVSSDRMCYGMEYVVWAKGPVLGPVRWFSTDRRRREK